MSRSPTVQKENLKEKKKPKLPGPHKEGKEGATQTLIQGTEDLYTQAARHRPRH